MTNSQILDAINQNIKRNENKEITGDILNSVLRMLLDFVNQGFITFSENATDFGAVRKSESNEVEAGFDLHQKDGASIGVDANGLKVFKGGITATFGTTSIYVDNLVPDAAYKFQEILFPKRAVKNVEEKVYPVTYIQGVKADDTGRVDISGIAWDYTNPSIRYSGIVDKSADATYNVFPILDGNGNLAKASNSYNALLNSLTLMTPTQKVNIMKLFNGQYSSGQIKTDMILMPVIEIGDNLNGLSKLDIYGVNLLIDPDTSYVRIKEFGNVNNWEDCVWNNVDSTRLEVFVNNSFLEIGKTYVFEIKHSVQVHTTVVSIDVVQQLNNVDLNTLTYTITKDNVNNADGYLDISVDANGLISHSVKAQAPDNLRGRLLKKVRTNPIAQYSENLVIIIDFNWGYSTGGFEFPQQYDKMGLSKVIQYTENDVSNNIVAGVGTGYQGFNNGEKSTAIIGGGFISKSGIGQCIIVKKGGVITTILMMNGAIIRYSSNATVTENYAVEFYFVGRYLSAKSVGTYKISTIKKF